MTRSVSRVREPEPSTHIGIIGFIVAIGSFLILLPLLPILIVLWLIDKVWGGDRTTVAMERMRSEDAPPPALED